jgi:PhoH-like ATPase
MQPHPTRKDMVQKRKFFILDTNVILHDSTCINHFEEHDIILPITVLEELDGFKKGNQTINYHAREFVRSLDSLSSGERSALAELAGNLL